jgi:hypothetical protein
VPGYPASVRQRADVGHVEKWQPALDMIDETGAYPHLSLRRTNPETNLTKPYWNRALYAFSAGWPPRWA